MLTIDEIKAVGFDTVGKKGYLATDVDEFVDEVIATIEQLTAEKNDCVRKMDFLADKVEQYRSKEETINNALYTAEQLKEEKIKEANSKAEYIIKRAEQRRRAILTEAEMATEREKDKFQALQEDVAKMREEIIAVYSKHIALIKELPDEEKVQRTREQLDEKYPFEPLEDEAEAEAPADVEEPAVPAAAAVPAADFTESARVELRHERRDKFDKLQFGDNFDV